MPGAEYGLVFSTTATNATSAVASKTGVAGKKIYITDIAGSSDKAGALILVKDGSTTVWQDRISNTGAYVADFTMPIVITAGATATVTVDGTALANANFSGYVL